MSAKPEEFIGGAAQVVEYYGYWATFHDAEVVSLLIEPEQGTITATFDYNDMTDDDSKTGSSRITLLWQKVIEYTLTADYKTLWMDRLWEIDFTQQNDWIETNILPTDGIGGNIHSRIIQVVGFEPRLKESNEKSNTAPD